MAEQTEVRVYGTADTPEPPASEGTRGAKSSIRPQRPDPDLSHQVRLETGRTVVVREGSGVAFAETTGRAGLADSKPWLDPAPYDGRSDRASRLPLVIGLAIAAGIIGLTAWRLWSDERNDWLKDADLRLGDDPGGGVGDRHVGHQSGDFTRPA